MHQEMFRLCSTQISIPLCSTAPRERLRQRYDKCDEYLWQPTYMPDRIKLPPQTLHSKHGKD
ncbi:MAG: hypothetical protein F6K42_26785 [Leptolyngbya sp. SIO1D8]|nr:hypothetical protein [Leptolyngbya sp. SIO1D8]